MSTSRNAMSKQSIDPNPVVDFNEVINELQRRVPDTSKFETEKVIYDIWSTSIESSSLVKNPQGIATLLNNMLQNSLYPNDLIFSKLLLICDREHYLEEASMLYNIAYEKGIAGIKTYEAMIILARQNKQFDKANDVYTIAIVQGKVSTRAFNSMIGIARQSKNFELAKEIFDAAIAAGNYNSKTFNILICAADESNLIDLVATTHEAAMTAKAANYITHGSTIKAAGKKGRIDLMEKAYQAALQRREVNDPLYHTMINALYINKRLDEAVAIYKSSGLKLTFLTEGNTYIDLHGFNRGSTYVALSEYFKKPEKPFQVGIIYGLGSNSELEDGEEHVCKIGTDEAIKEFRKEYDITVKKGVNEGRIIVTIKNKLTNELTDNNKSAIPAPSAPNSPVNRPRVSSPNLFSTSAGPGRRQQQPSNQPQINHNQKKTS